MRSILRRPRGRLRMRTDVKCELSSIVTKLLVSEFISCSSPNAFLPLVKKDLLREGDVIAFKHKFMALGTTVEKDAIVRYSIFLKTAPVQELISTSGRFRHQKHWRTPPNRTRRPRTLRPLFPYYIHIPRHLALPPRNLRLLRSTARNGSDGPRRARLSRPKIALPHREGVHGMAVSERSGGGV